MTRSEVHLRSTRLRLCAAVAEARAVLDDLRGELLPGGWGTAAERANHVWFLAVALMHARDRVRDALESVRRAKDLLRLEQREASYERDLKSLIRRQRRVTRDHKRLFGGEA